MENLRLCSATEDSFVSLAKGYRKLKTLFMGRVSTMKVIFAISHLCQAIICTTKLFFCHRRTLTFP